MLSIDYAINNSRVDLLVILDYGHVMLCEYVVNKYECDFIFCFDDVLTPTIYSGIIANQTFLNKSKKIIFCSDYFKIHKLPLYNTITILNGIYPPCNSDAQIVLPGINNIKMLYIGRLSPEKNTNILSVFKYYRDIDLIIIGSCFGYKPPAGDNIYYLGSVGGNLRFNYMSKVDAVVVPSIYDSFNIVCLEALMLKTTLLCSYADGISTWLDKNAAINCGITEESLYKAIAWYRRLSLRELKEMQDYGYNFASKFSAESMVNEYEKVITDAIKR